MGLVGADPSVARSPFQADHSVTCRRAESAPASSLGCAVPRTTLPYMPPPVRGAGRRESLLAASSVAVNPIDPMTSSDCKRGELDRRRAVVGGVRLAAHDVDTRVVTGTGRRRRQIRRLAGHRDGGKLCDCCVPTSLSTP